MCYPKNGGLKILKAWNSGFWELEQFGQIDVTPKKKHTQILKGRFNLNLNKTRNKKGVIPAFRMQRYVKYQWRPGLNSFKPQYTLDLINRERCILYRIFWWYLKIPNTIAGCPIISRLYIVSKKGTLLVKNSNIQKNLKHFCAQLAITLSILAARQWFILDFPKNCFPGDSKCFTTGKGKSHPIQTTDLGVSCWIFRSCCFEGLKLPNSLPYLGGMLKISLIPFTFPDTQRWYGSFTTYIAGLKGGNYVDMIRTECLGIGDSHFKPR